MSVGDANRKCVVRRDLPLDPLPKWSGVSSLEVLARSGRSANGTRHQHFNPDEAVPSVVTKQEDWDDPSRRDEQQGV